MSENKPGGAVALFGCLLAGIVALVALILPLTAATLGYLYWGGFWGAVAGGLILAVAEGVIGWGIMFAGPAVMALFKRKD